MPPGPGFRPGLRFLTRRQTWGLTIEAVLADGETVPLAEIRGRSTAEILAIDEQCRPVHGPDFVIIGTQRGGTTSLHAYLSAHPQVATPKTKELHFLTDRYERGLDWYRGQFPADAAARQ